MFTSRYAVLGLWTAGRDSQVNASVLLFSLLRKIPNTNNSRKGVFRLSSLRVLFIMAGKAWLQKLEASAHITPTITQGTGGGCSAWIAFLLSFQPVTLAHRMMPLTFRVAFPLLSYPNEEIPPQACLELCFHGDSQSHQVGNRD